jgi:hypothetical protein
MKVLLDAGAGVNAASRVSRDGMVYGRKLM